MAGDAVLTQDAADYLGVRRAAGFALKTAGSALLTFARFAASRGERHIKTTTAVAWAGAARTSAQREYRLRLVILFSRHLRADDARHELPVAGVFGRGSARRPVPFIFSSPQVSALIEAARNVDDTGPFQPLMFATLFGLLACTGMRVSEALKLRLDDVTPDGLVIRETKFRKSRMIPLHPTAQSAIDAYLLHRRRRVGVTVFCNDDGQRVVYSRVLRMFECLIHDIRLDASTKRAPKPHIHSLRHTFAVRSLESSPGDPMRVDAHQVALATYMGHVALESTYWYLETTQLLMTGIAESAEKQHRRAS